MNRTAASAGRATTRMGWQLFAGILILALGLSQSALAATYWVSPIGKAAWAKAKSKTPLKGLACSSLQIASKSVRPGDVVYLRGGDYTGKNSPRRSRGFSSGITTWSDGSEIQRVTSAASTDTVMLACESSKRAPHFYPRWMRT